MKLDDVLVIWSACGLGLGVIWAVVLLGRRQEDVSRRACCGCFVLLAVGLLLPFAIGVGATANQALHDASAARAKHERVRAKLTALSAYAKAIDWGLLNRWPKSARPYVRGRVLYLKETRDAPDEPLIHYVEDLQADPPPGIPAELFARTPAEVGTIILTVSEYSVAHWRAEGVAGLYNRSTTETYLGIRVTLYDLKGRKIAGQTLLGPNETDPHRSSPIAWVASLPRR